MEYEIRAYCQDCGGQGEVTWGNPNNPSAILHSCRPCEGRGVIKYREDYDSNEDAQADYPDAFSITCIASERTHNGN